MQTAITLIMVASAALYLVRNLVFRKKSSEAGDCGCGKVCPVKKLPKAHA